MKHVEDLEVKDLMTWGVVTVPEDSRVIDVVNILVSGHVHTVAVVSKTGKAVGIVSDIDIIKAFGRDFSEVSVGEIMTKNIKTVRPDTKIKDAGEMMEKYDIHRLIVLNGNGNLQGVLSVTDIMREIVKIMKYRK